MLYLTAILISLAFFVGFLLVTMYETRHGIRFFAGLRLYLDRRMNRATFIASHVDWNALTKHLVRSTAERILHDIAHGILLFVRLIERLLTRFVRQLRGRRQELTEETKPLEVLRTVTRRARSVLTLRRLGVKEKEGE